jgi:hypothetical protein
MNWYKQAQENFETPPLLIEKPKQKLPKGWKLTIKKDKSGLYEAHLWLKDQYGVTSPIPLTVPMLFDYPSKAREGAVAWLQHQLSRKKY